MAKFARPNWDTFTKDERKKVLRGKVFGVTLGTGAKLFCHVGQPFTGLDFAKLVRDRIGPFFKESYPDTATLRILLDGEPLMHT